MSNSGVNAGFAKCFILFMVIVILLQGCAYLGLAIWGITLKSCQQQSTNITDDPITFIIDLIYLTDQDCGNPRITLSISDSDIDSIIGNITGGGILTHTQEIAIDWTKASAIKDRMYIFLLAYAVISALWIVTSMLVFGSICCVITKKVTAICYWPWFLVVMAGCVLDAVATGFFVKDIYNTTSAENTMNYVGVIDDEWRDRIEEYLKTYDAYFIVPAAVMTFISSRLVLIWVLNIVGVIFCLSLARVLSARSTAHTTKRKPCNPVDDVVVVSRCRYPEESSQLQQPPTQRDYIPPKPLPVQHAVATAPLEVSRSRKDRRSLEPLKAHLSEDQWNGNSSNQINGIDTTTYRSCDSHPENLDYPIQNRPISNSPDQHSSPRSMPSELSAVSPLNNRYSTADSFPFQSQPHVSEELRSQLPWSYTNLFTGGQMQQRKGNQSPGGAEFPQIPAPDYSMQSPLREQTHLVNSTEQPHSYSRW